MRLKEQLTYYLTARDMTPTSLARKSKVPRQNIANWLMGQKPKDVAQVKRVADVFGVSIDNLLFEDHPTSPKNNVPTEITLHGLFEISIKRISDKS